MTQRQRQSRHPNVEATKKHRPKLETRAKALDTDTNLSKLWEPPGEVPPTNWEPQHSIWVSGDAPSLVGSASQPSWISISHFELKNGGFASGDFPKWKIWWFLGEPWFIFRRDAGEEFLSSFSIAKVFGVCGKYWLFDVWNLKHGWWRWITLKNQTKGLKLEA